jgi:gluconate:H+ symporter, GntP family
MSTTYILISFVISILLMILLISKFKVHPAMGILISVLLLGIIIGTPLDKITGTINQGFADTVKSIAIVIVLGSLLGKVLEETGAAVSITRTIVNKFGKKRVIWAIAASAAILGIPVFADSVVILLIPIVSVLAAETGESMMKYGGALYLGALVTASLVPPTPGPVAAAALLKLPLGQAIIWGLIVSVPSIIAGVIYLKTIKIQVPPKEEYLKAAEESKLKVLPSTFISLIPIIVPLVLIMLNTYIATQFPKTDIANVFAFVGDPLPALLIGCFTSMFLVGPTWKTKKVLNDWVEDSLKMSAMPIIVTGLGGALAIFIKNAKVAEQIANGVMNIGIPGILIPIVIAAIIHVITGSNALGVMTAAALVQPMLGILGISPLAAFLACGTGALMFKHANSSGFWVTTSMSNMTLVQGIITVGGFSTVAGFVGAVFTVILHYVGAI